ncbi:MAG TPA: acetylornithine transaminase [Syntrophales bacterium]|nr:acetylornithine transaminase [Syntrophales bacterium]HOM07351.1 acetylornithine transaminase [Syntrophales bacterium]HON98944.1 acetylornithine transaminase [Syntrophales bacterium]HPC00408.1 acetylornithine transaminase [Syntrophales bacterium]HPQ07011.1 acetylornithine transaminase [Syntrophales bacterium]
MTTQELMALGERVIMGTYRRFPVVLARGEGSRVWDTEGKEYLDFVGGIAVCALGHCHPAVAEAVSRQVSLLCHVSNLYHIENQILYAAMLIKRSFADQVFFCNSGAEANEAAIKLARKYGNERLGGRHEIITMKGSFHGRTLATVAATGQEKFHKGFQPLPAGFRYVPFNDLDALKEAVNDKTCAVMVEPIQAEGGVNVPDGGYLAGVRALCDEQGILMILDEVQTGMGRTGTMFAHEYEGVTPHIMTLAKALGNGFPLGAMLATSDVASAFEPGSHASTFGGNPLAMAAARATLEIIAAEGFLEGVRERSSYFLEGLRELQRRLPVVKEVRGRGMLLGVELNAEGAEIIDRCREKGLLIASAGPRVLRFVPPLIVTRGEMDRALEILGEVLAAT